MLLESKAITSWLEEKDGIRRATDLLWEPLSRYVQTEAFLRCHGKYDVEQVRIAPSRVAC